MQVSRFRWLGRGFVAVCVLAQLACGLPSGPGSSPGGGRTSDPNATRTSRVAGYTALTKVAPPTPIIDVGYRWVDASRSHSEESPGWLVARLRVAPENLEAWRAGCEAAETFELSRTDGPTVDGWPAMSRGSNTYSCGDQERWQWRRLFPPDGVRIEEMVDP